MIFRGTLILLLITSITLNILFSGMIFMIHKDFNRRLVFDIDKVRADYIHDVQFTFREACKTGTDYPPEYRKPTIEWNDNSPINWCNRQLEGFQGTIDHWLPYLGRTR